VILAKDNRSAKNGCKECALCDCKECMIHSFFACPFAHLLWRTVHFTIDIPPPGSVTNNGGAALTPAWSIDHTCFCQKPIYASIKRIFLIIRINYLIPGQARVFKYFQKCDRVGFHLTDGSAAGRSASSRPTAGRSAGRPADRPRRPLAG
jgi:hypothetical protein